MPSLQPYLPLLLYYAEVIHATVSLIRVITSPPAIRRYKKIRKAMPLSETTLPLKTVHTTTVHCSTQNKRTRWLGGPQKVSDKIRPNLSASSPRHGWVSTLPAGILWEQ